MSPLWRDEVAIYLSPGRIVLARMKRGIRPSICAECDLPVLNTEIGRWEPALDVLEEPLREPAWQSAAARLIVADHWARFAIVPWSDALAESAERLEHARFCLTRTYGDIVSQWRVTLSDSPPGVLQVACAIPAALLDRIQELAEARGLRIKSVQPQLIAAFNSWRDRLPKEDAWFVSLEPGSLAAAHFTAAGWDRVHSIRIGEDWVTELRRLRTVGRLARTGGDAARVYVDSPHWLRAADGQGQDDLIWLADSEAGEVPPERFGLLQRIYA